MKKKNVFQSVYGKPHTYLRVMQSNTKFRLPAFKRIYETFPIHSCMGCFLITHMFGFIPDSRLINRHDEELRGMNGVW